MKTRLLQLLGAENLTALKFAEIMEVRPSNISHIMSGRNNPGFDFISRLLLRFPEVNPDWLINGLGEMYRTDSTDALVLNARETADNQPCLQMSTPLNGRESDDDIAVDLFSLDSQDENPIEVVNVNESVVLRSDEDTEPKDNSQPISEPAYISSKQVEMFESAEMPKLPLLGKTSNPVQILMFYDDNTYEYFTPRK